MPNDAAISKLETAAEGLRFRSESDYPFDAVRWTKADIPELSKAPMLAALGKPAETRFEEITLEHLFRNVSKVEDWQDDDVKEEVVRYQGLMKALRENLAGVRVFRVGTIEIDVYILGESADGDWAGLHTMVVET